MKKIPTMFLRDWDKNPQFITPKPNPVCDWVFQNEGLPTQKLDGTSCLMKNGQLFKRRELKQNDKIPNEFVEIDFDEETKKRIGWIPTHRDDPSDRWHYEAYDPNLPDGTYELVGPKVQGNPEHFQRHVLVPHGFIFFDKPIPRDFEGLKSWFVGQDIEGIVFHHPDARMAKIKMRDFGLKRITMEAKM